MATKKKEPKKKPELPEKISFKYIIPDPCPQLYINGAYGGITPRKEIQANLYFERPAMPKSVTHKIEEDGRLGPEIDRDQKHELVRVIQSSIVMDAVTAERIAGFLMEKVELIKAMKKGDEL